MSVSERERKGPQQNWQSNELWDEPLSIYIERDMKFDSNSVDLCFYCTFSRGQGLLSIADGLLVPHIGHVGRGT